ncbi:flagellar basal body P-ring formation chaperone FlgA [Methylocapsa polymorpha]|uniref:Flagella basal body P-ring formation protein FlgA n=1 Tax=Methylocapsa polymorpha TaxID=3080828 RepID=A0ABZ0HPF5_9HYPH|nr:flagellar basal body P-ring formation chaperone FlgA [Methylocapsa sp. RX1]
MTKMDKATPLFRSIVAGACAFCAFVCFGSLRAAESNVLPVPTITIYPGDSIKDAWLVDREFSSSFIGAKGALIDSRATIVGKVARRTLLPGAPIPWNAIMEPKAVANGAKVKMVFEEGGLTITTYGAALQSGSVGEVISVRNLDSGVTISGTVQSDGSIRVSGG